ncbi:MAG TPA: TlyA family RNA methyltransferase [Candidatus Saccharimonadales bacterium]
MNKQNRPRQRLDVELVKRKLLMSRSQAESYIKLGRVKVNRRPADKAGQPIKATDKLSVSGEQYVSRAAFKLASAVEKLNVDFKDKIVLDVGSSTGGFTDYALAHGAKLVIAVDVGTNQLHPTLRADKRVELHEKTDIRDFQTDQIINLVLIDVSFISLRQVLPAISKLLVPNSQILAMVKPQFEAGGRYKHKGVIKNDAIRRQILKEFEEWVRNKFSIVGKADSEISGAKGNRERFYLLRSL